jgi:hypothetical protein
MLAETLQQRIETIPVLRTLLEAVYRKRFSGNAWGAFHGVYENFAKKPTGPRRKQNLLDLIVQHTDRNSRIGSRERFLLTTP